MKKKALSLFLALCLLLILLPTASAATHSGSFGQGMYWKLDTASGTLTVSGNGSIPDFYTPVPWDAYREQIRSIVIKEGVKTIGHNAFRDLGALTKVTIGSGVTEIGQSVFFGCTNLESITLPSSLTAIGASSFYPCTALKSVYITSVAAWCKVNFDFNANPLCNGADLYLNGSRVEKLQIPEGVTAIGNEAFGNCLSLKEVSIANSVTSIGDHAFFGCLNLEKVTIGSGTSSISGNSFTRTPALKEIRVSESNVHYCSDNSGVLYSKDMTHLLLCPGQYAGSFSVPNTVKSIGERAFNNTAHLTKIDIPDSVTSVGFRAFEDSGVQQVTLGSGLTELDYSAFSFCSSLESIQVSEANPALSTDATGSLFDKAQTVLIRCPARFSGDYTVPDTVQLIYNFAFFSCTSLRSAVLPDSVTEIRSNAFEGCSNLIYISLGSGLERCDSSFLAGCKKLCHIIFTGTSNQWSGLHYSHSHYAPNAKFHCDVPADTVCKVSVGNLSYFYCSLCDQILNDIFEDVPKTAYYYEPIQWAVTEGITTGTSDTAFSPEMACTRAQIVTFLYRAFGSPEPVSEENPFADVKESAYYYKAVLWAVEQGITNGTGEGQFSPEETCTRGQVATFLYRACGSPEGNRENQFSDVNSGQYYYEPVLWAVAEGITNGTGDGNFSPEETCTRGQIVTFLYRTLAS